MNSDYCRLALAKVGNPNILINLISRRVRQLNAGGGGTGRPLVETTPSMGLSDIAMLEIIEDKMSFQMSEMETPVEKPVRRRKR